MKLLALLRHGPTDWNRQGRIQGRRDVPLGDEAREWLTARQLPPDLSALRWYSSPLARARETARLVGLAEAMPDNRLIEMDWGAWEGRTLAELRREIGPAMAENEARGLDFTPENGESPRQVQQRLRGWLVEMARPDRERESPDGVGAVTHKGVIRAALALAYGWNMREKPPVRLDWGCVHLFQIGPEEIIRPSHMNIPLSKRK